MSQILDDDHPLHLVNLALHFGLPARLAEVANLTETYNYVYSIKQKEYVHTASILSIYVSTTQLDSLAAEEAKEAQMKAMTDLISPHQS